MWLNVCFGLETNAHTQAHTHNTYYNEHMNFQRNTDHTPWHYKLQTECKAKWQLSLLLDVWKVNRIVFLRSISTKRAHTHKICKFIVILNGNLLVECITQRVLSVPKFSKQCQCTCSIFVRSIAIRQMQLVWMTMFHTDTNLCQTCQQLWNVASNKPLMRRAFC